MLITVPQGTPPWHGYSNHRDGIASVDVAAADICAYAQIKTPQLVAWPPRSAAPIASSATL